MRVYLDACAICRSGDDAIQPRIATEIIAIDGLLAQIRSGAIELVSSMPLELELKNVPDQTRRERAFGIIRLALESIRITDDVLEVAKRFQTFGIHEMDSLHVASAIVAECDYLVTCDDRLMKKCRTLNTHPTDVVSPIDVNWGMIT